MMKNKHLSKAVASQKFYEFRTKLETTCKKLGIELRVEDVSINPSNDVINVDTLRTI